MLLLHPGQQLLVLLNMMGAAGQKDGTKRPAGLKRQNGPRRNHGMTHLL